MSRFPPILDLIAFWEIATLAYSLNATELNGSVNIYQKTLKTLNQLMTYNYPKSHAYSKNVPSYVIFIHVKLLN